MRYSLPTSMGAFIIKERRNESTRSLEEERQIVTSAIQWRDALGDPLTDSCSLSIGRSPYLSNLSSGGTGCIIQRLGKPYYIVHEVNFDLHLYDEI